MDEEDEYSYGDDFMMLEEAKIEENDYSINTDKKVLKSERA